MRTNGSEQRRLTTLRAKSAYPCWSPDGQYIAFETDVSGNDEIFVMRSDGTGLLNVTNHPGRDTSASWSLDGKRLAFVSDRAGKADIYVMVLPDSTAAQKDRAQKRCECGAICRWIEENWRVKL